MGRSHSSPADGPLMLRRVLEDPADDAPRLTYADWLEEAGQEERAEFIRIQCRWPDQIARVEYCRGNAVGSPLIEWLDSMTSIVGHQNYDARWQRGFISEIRLTCEQFVGGTCKTCNGDGKYYSSRPDSFWDKCEMCNGTGRIEGLAKRIFSEHPVVKAVLTDKQPLRFDNRWLLHNANHRFVSTDYDDDSRPSDHITELLFSKIKVQLPQRTDVTDFVKRFRTEQEANDALSDACVSYGRSLAGLPPLP